MKDGLNELDQTHAIFSALGSFWWRLLVFFLCFWFAHYLGQNAMTGGALLRDVWQNGPSALFQQSNLNPIWVPLSWFWTVLAGCSTLPGVAYLFVIGTALLIVRLSEDHFYHAFAIALILQPIHTVLVSGSGSLTGFDLGVTVFVLLVYEVCVIGLYWWILRQME